MDGHYYGVFPNTPNFTGLGLFFGEIASPNYGDDPQLNLQLTTHLDTWDADGIITRDPERSQKTIKKGIPTIVAIQRENPIPEIPRILLDHGAIGKMAANHFIERGF